MYSLVSLKECHPELGENCLPMVQLINLNGCHPELGENCIPATKLNGIGLQNLAGF